ncbi:MAG TPA: hypothetical protein VGN86_18065 [Pyrinomonadaceae bacterium]|jgi:hypothetical protein|nr:hypothetical protein [Pyrinomonadaceae bacterium]
MRDREKQDINRLTVALDSPVLENVTIEIVEATGQTVTVYYKTLPGNHPLENGNKLWIWEGTVIDWSHPEKGINTLIPSDDSVGSFSMQVEQSHKDYTAGYSVTGPVMGICASAIMNPPPETALELLVAPTSVTLEIYSLTPTQLGISYATLRGYQPLKAGNWLALWRGDVLPWDAPPPIAVTLPEDNANEGLATFTLITPLRPGSTYTVIYFMADKDKQTENTSAAALLRFVAS